MNAKTKEWLIYGGGAIAAVVLFYFIVKAPVTTSPATADDGSGLNLGAPDINIIGGSYPLTWDSIPATQPTDPQGVGAASNILYMPILNNYNQQANTGCNSCSGTNGGLVSSAENQFLITTQLMDNLSSVMANEIASGYTKINGVYVAPHYGRP